MLSQQTAKVVLDQVDLQGSIAANEAASERTSLGDDCLVVMRLMKLGASCVVRSRTAR